MAERDEPASRPPGRQPQGPQARSPADDAAAIVRSAMKGALATIERPGGPSTGHPYASLVTVATEPWGTPLLLLSKLALHTLNLEADSRASLLLEAPVGPQAPNADPLTAGRVTVIGRCAPTASASARRRFLSRHPSAELYAGFPDFRLFALEVERAHYVGGFGRISGIDARGLVLPDDDCAALAAAEEEILGTATDQLAGRLAAISRGVGRSGGGMPAARAAARLAGVDPLGCDIDVAGDMRRVMFEAPVWTADAALRAIAETIPS